MFSPSIFSEVLKLLPRDRIKRLVADQGADRWRKSFRTWDHLVAMLAAQLSGVTSLRDVELLFDQQRAQLYHLNCHGVKRSTLADANKGRDYRVFAAIARLLIEMTGRRGRKAKRLLSVLDSSPIRLQARGHDWAERSRTRVGNQGLKMHLLLTPGDGGLDYAAVTDMNVNDITKARDMPLEAGRIYVMDKGYCDYNWWLEIIEAGSHFVTRLKANAAYRVVETRPLGAGEVDHIRSDQIIELTNKAPRGGKINRLAGRRLRLVEIDHPGGKTSPFLIVSDMLDAPASEITACYKQRWQIELLFKWLKQNLKIKRFMGESRNAIQIQIFVALIAYLLVRLYKQARGEAHEGRRLKDLLVTIKAGLFQQLPLRRRRNSQPSPLQAELWEAI